MPDRDQQPAATFPLADIAGFTALIEQARVAKAFNQVHAEVWKQAARYDGRPQLVPIAGDREAKAVASRLIRHAGGIEHAHELEAMAAVVIRLLVGGANPLSAFQFTVGAANVQAVADAAQ